MSTKIDMQVQKERLEAFLTDNEALEEYLKCSHYGHTLDEIFEECATRTPHDYRRGLKEILTNTIAWGRTYDSNMWNDLYRKWYKQYLTYEYSSYTSEVEL
jgi:hypothetical protein